ncbi:MAG: S26 family signal peptidase [Myxococcota bacterium]
MTVRASLLVVLARALARTVGLQAFRVTGPSMEPTLREGDWVLVSTSRLRLPQPGRIVIVHDPAEARALIKRVRSRGTGTFTVGSDNPVGARDSRHFGSLRLEHLIGHVIGGQRCSKKRDTRFFPLGRRAREDSNPRPSA